MNNLLVQPKANLTIVTLLLLLFCFSAKAIPNEGKLAVDFREKSSIKGSVKQGLNIERIQIRHSRSAITLDKNLTSDNSYILASDYSRGQNTVADIIQQTAGISLNGQGGLFQSYNIRGFSRARIKTEVNGIPIISDRRAGNAISFLPAALINGVDIKKGPSSTLYGSDAIGGVVSISTINFNDALISLEFKPQEDAVQFLANLANDNLTATFLQRKANNSQSVKADINGSKVVNTQYQQQVSSLAGQYRWQSIDIQASTLFSQGKDIGKSSAEFPYSKITLYPNDEHWLSKIQFSKDDWQLSFYHHMQNWQSDIQRLDSENSNLFERENITHYKSDTLGSLGLFIWDSMIFGAEWIGRRNIDISEQEFDGAGELVWKKDKVRANEDTLAFFVQQAWQFKNFALNAGARYDWQQVKQNLTEDILTDSTLYTDKVSDDFLSLSVNTQYIINSQTQLAFTFANAFRFPSVSELFFSGETPRGNTQGNSALAPEESLGYQVDIKYHFYPTLSLLLNGYYYQISNYIERYQLTTNTGFRSYRNSSEVILQGFELSTHWQVNSSLSSQLSYQKQLARDKNKNTLDDALPEMLKWQVSWFPEHPWLANISIENKLTYQFEKTTFGDAEQALPSALVWHSTINYQLNSQQNLILSLTNITNKAYRASADEDAALQPERTISLKWQWQFN